MEIGEPVRASIAAMLSNPRHKSDKLAMKAEFTEVEAVLTSDSRDRQSTRDRP